MLSNPPLTANTNAPPPLIYEIGKITKQPFGTHVKSPPYTKEHVAVTRRHPCIRPERDAQATQRSANRYRQSTIQSQDCNCHHMQKVTRQSNYSEPLVNGQPNLPALLKKVGGRNKTIPEFPRTMVQRRTQSTQSL